ncbi:hypothetical protein FA10DRAFT_270039 [Acaromyces ingoldii]|uniref:Uncharacterized protein n=1 Tax=Acaromyces ingoldii TaxID=215250 RepID=A0A316YAL5_9BASI|nr:hypothetical protein FA10DRAFT_270039 [Acaromyces ingoldii]PWN86667.1 hypothetical protein FA10DRAFT_270039 [Acaromyces ingoldii]
MATTRYIGRERDHHREAILRQKQTVRDDEEDAYSRARLAVSSAPLCQSLPDFTVVIEFCNRSKWLHRAIWIQTELFLSFPKASTRSTIEEPPTKASSEGFIEAIMLHPQSASDTAGRFRVLLHLGETKTIWDRQIRGSFPDLKELKQIMRSLIADYEKC